MARYNPESSRDLNKLREAVSFSRRKFAPFQRRHVEIWRHYAANQHDEDDFDRMLPMNMIRMAIDIWSRGLAAKSPRVLVNASNPGLQPRAYEVQLAVDHLLKEIKFAKTLKLVVRSALVTMGVLKVGLTDAPLGESLSIYHDEGQAFADNVLMQDWIHDMNARSTEEWEFCGNRYRVPLEDVRENPMFRGADRLQATHLRAMSDGEYADSDILIETITQGTSMVGNEEYVEHVELQDIWLPRENLVVTLGPTGDEPLLVTEWDGPERGPFHVLAFGEIPGNVIPTGAIGSLFDIHDLLNRLFVKLGDQAERQKTTFAASQAATQDGSAMARINAQDGEVISTAHPDAIKEMRSGGVDQQSLAFVGWLRGIGSYVGGNLDTLGGLQSGAETLGQEKLLQQQSSGMMDDMQSTVEMFVKDVVTDLAWWQYTSPDLTLPLKKTSVGGRFEMPFEWGPEKREANFFEYSFEITPFSTQPQTPRDKLQFMSQFVRQEVLPMAQAGLLAQSGMQFDPKQYFRIMAQYADMPEINMFLKVNGQNLPMEPPGAEAMSGGGMGGGMPSNTTRTTIRKSETQGGQAAMDRQMMEGAMGASMPQGVNPSMMPSGA